MAWDKTKPANDELLINFPAQCRANWDAIELGTDANLLITNAKCSPSMGLVDTKLVQITTASKVSGAALTLLANIPGGAGLIPVANIPNLSATKITSDTLVVARGGTNLASAGGVANRVLITLDGLVFSVGQIALASMVSGTLPDSNLDQIVSVSKVSGAALTLLTSLPAGAGKVPTANLGTGIASASSYLRGDQSWQTIDATPPDASISQAKLKIATGSIFGGSGNYALPGGSYGFYPQVKSDGSPGTFSIANGITTGSYTTYIYVSGSGGYYAQQTYITASGEDMWVFLLLDKATKKIIGGYEAFDHPAYGNGGDFAKLPHPFGSYDESKYEIVLLDKETCVMLKRRNERTKESVLDLVKEYRLDILEEMVYQPLHSGKYLVQDKGGKQVQVKQMVASIPDYIKVRRLV